MISSARPVFKILFTVLTLTLISINTLQAETIKIGRESDSTTLDPIKTAQNVDIWIISNIHASLVRSNREGVAIEPDLAESWTVSDDKLRFTFALRDAKFSDGSPVTAEDAVFSLLRLRDDENSAQGWLVDGIKSVTASDSKTVVIELKEPAAAFIPTLALYAAAIVPKKVVEAGADGFGANPVGAGRYRLKSWSRGQTLTLEPNPHYYGGTPTNADSVEYQVVPDSNTRVLKVQAGELDVAMGVPFALVSALQKDPKVQVHLDASTRADHLLLNHENEWLANKDVRKAIDMAINKEAIIKVVTFGNGVVANSPIPQGTPFYNADAKNHPYDPDQAKALIKEAGAEGATLTFLVGAGNKLREQTGVIVQQQLQAIGLNVEIKKIDAGQVWNTFKEGGYDIAPAYWTYDVLDPDHKLAFSLDGGKNNSYHTRYKNPEVTELINEARAELDSDKRQSLYNELLSIAKQDVHWVDLYYSPFSNISKQGVSGFFQSPMGVVPLHEISLN